MHIALDELRSHISRRFPTKTQFGAYVGWDQAKVTRITRGYQFPTLNEIWRIAEATGMSDDDIISTFFAKE